jgi:hypothetical protein
VEVELRRVVEENRRLRGMLEELNRSYGALYQQLLQVTQHRQHPADLMINRSSLAHVSAIFHPIIWKYYSHLYHYLSRVSS